MYGIYKSINIGQNKFLVPMSHSVPDDVFQETIFFTRRLMGYIVYPRWFAARMFLAECIEKLKKRGIYRQEVKRQTKALLNEMDILERKHVIDFDKDFVEVMAAHMAGEAMGMINSLRGDIGGILLNHNLKEYVFYSYPETFLVLANDNIRCWKQILEEIMQKHGIDFRCVFKPLEGARVKEVGQLWLQAIEHAVGEPIPYGIDGDDTMAMHRLVSLDRLMIDYSKMKDAFVESYNELPDEKKELSPDFVKSLQEEKSNTHKNELVAELSKKYKVKSM